MRAMTPQRLTLDARGVTIVGMAGISGRFPIASLFLSALRLVMSMHLPFSTPTRRARSARGVGLAALTLCALLALSLAGCGGIGSDPVAAATVDGHTIPLATYQRVLDLYRIATVRQGQSPDWKSPEGRGTVASMQASAMQFLTGSVLIDDQAGKQHLKVTAKDLQTSTQSFASVIKSWSDQTPDDPDVRALMAAANQAIKDAAHNPSLDALLAGDPSFSNVILLFGREDADYKALLASAKVPTAHVRVILVKTQQEADNLKAQAEAKKADFGTLAQQNSLDKTSGQNGGALTKPSYFVGELSQLSPSFDTYIFGSKANYADKVSYVVFPLESTKASDWVLCEVTQRAVTSLSTESDAQTRSQIFNAWLQLVIQPASNIQQYVAIDPTPTTSGANAGQ